MPPKIAITNDDGNLVSQQRYLPFGGVREDVSNLTQTDHGYTGQRDLGSMGLMDYKARFYSPLSGRFIQPDTIIPNFNNPQTWNRFSYVINNPINKNDPTGHDACGSAPEPWHSVCLSNLGRSDQIAQTPIVSRADWEAHDPGSYGQPSGDGNEGLYPDIATGYESYLDANPETPLADILDSIVIHHEGAISITDAGYSGAEAVKRIQEIMMENGYYDIGYHYIISSDGTIYEGRDIGVRGSHVSGKVGNTGKIGVLWLGSFNEASPTNSQVASTANLIVSLDREFGIDVVGGHGEFEAAIENGSGTECPGPFAAPFVNIFKQLIQ